MTINPLERVFFGIPQPCPICGGRLQPMFGQQTDAAGRVYPVLDATRVLCRDCREVFNAEPARAKLR
jgi:phage terminase large subunit GpA-like protein